MTTSYNTILPFDQGARDFLARTGEKIVADRYLQKGGELKKGAIVVVILKVEQFGKMREIRELGRVKNINVGPNNKTTVDVELADGGEVTVDENMLDVLKEKAPHEMWKRIAKGVVKGIPKGNKTKWQKEFEWLLSNYQYIPGGRILSSMGSVDADGNEVQTTSYNCFVIPNVGPDSEDYAKSFGQTLEIQARSGGVGMNLSFLPPQGTIVPVTEVKRTRVQLVMDVWHPDLFDFVNETPMQDIENPYENSVKVVRITKEFKEALEQNKEWTFEFPDHKAFKTDEKYKNLSYDEEWNGNLEEWKQKGYPVETYDTVSASDVMDLLLEKNVTIVDGVLATKVNPGDSRGQIAKALGETWTHLIAGKKVAVVLSSLRPRNARVVGVNGRSSGAYSWGVLYDRANWAFAQGFGPVAIAQIMSIGCLLVIQGGSRRGALMIVLNDWHKDIKKFINAKRDMSLINGANISVGVSDKFMEAKEKDEDWTVGYVNVTDFEKYEKSYYYDEKDFIAEETISAKALWNEMMKAAHGSAEPGVIFMERYNRMSNSYYYADVISTNPCGEQGLPGWAICNLGAINLAKVANGWYDRPNKKTVFTNKELEKHVRKELSQFFDEEKTEFLLYHIDWELLERITRVGLRFQDAVIDATYYPFEENKKQQLSERRVGLGIMGLHDLMLYCGIKYGSEESEHFSDVLLGMIAEWCYLESSELAKENGAFPQYDEEKFLASGYMKYMASRKPHVIEAIKKNGGVRNVTTMTIAPTGTTGTMVGISTGCEPYYAWEYFRNSRLGTFMEAASIVQDYRDAHPEITPQGDFSDLPEHFVGSMDLTPEEHIRVQAALQRWIDSSISKTCNAPNTFTVEDVSNLYTKAYELGCKGVTIYVDGSRDTQVLETKKDEKEEVKETAQETKQTAVQPEEPVYKKKTRNNPLYGATYKKHTPMGSAYITINDDLETNLSREIFVNVGKAGSDVFAAFEALGRVITLYLMDSPNPNKEAALVKHLSGIGGQNSVGFGPNRITSVPDAIAKALIEHAETFPLRQLKKDALKPKTEVVKEVVEEKAQEIKEEVSSLRRATISRDYCPDCGLMSLVNEGGCNKCEACGYSKC